MGNCHNNCGALDDEDHVSIVHWKEQVTSQLTDKEKERIQQMFLADNLIVEILDERIYLTIEGFRHIVSTRVPANSGLHELLAETFWLRRLLAEKAYVRSIACPQYANSCNYDAPISSIVKTYVCQNAATWFKLRQLITEESKMERENYFCARRMDARDAEMAKWDRQHRKFLALMSVLGGLETIALDIASFDSDFKDVVQVYHDMSCKGGRYRLSGGYSLENCSINGSRLPNYQLESKKSSVDLAAFKSSSASSTSYLARTAW